MLLKPFPNKNIYTHVSRWTSDIGRVKTSILKIYFVIYFQVDRTGVSPPRWVFSSRN